MSFKNIEHIFFDLDHTLWDFDRNAEETIRELLVHYQPQMSRQLNFEEFFTAYVTHNERLWRRYRENKIEFETLRHIRWEITFRDLGIEMGDWVQQLSKDFISIGPRKPHLLPNAIEVLEHLGQRFPLHIISNGFSDIQAIKMASSGLDRFFGHVVCPDHAGHLKPDPRIFRYALEATGAQSVSSLYVGDNYQADVLGARKAEMPVVFFNPKGEDNPDGVAEIGDLRELLGLFG